MTGRVGHHGILILGNGEVVRPAQTVLVMKDDLAPGTPSSFVDPVGRTMTRIGSSVSIAADPGGFGGSCIKITGTSSNECYQSDSHANMEILTGDFTIEAFIRMPTNDPGGSYGTNIVGTPGASTSGFTLRANTGILAMVYPGLIGLNHAIAWAANTTYHVMACRQGSNHYVGVNGAATLNAGLYRTSSGTQIEVGQGSFQSRPAGDLFIAARVVKGLALYPGTSYAVPSGPL